MSSHGSYVSGPIVNAACWDRTRGLFAEWDAAETSLNGRRIAFAGVLSSSSPAEVDCLFEQMVGDLERVVPDKLRMVLLHEHGEYEGTHDERNMTSELLVLPLTPEIIAERELAAAKRREAAAQDHASKEQRIERDLQASAGPKPDLDDWLGKQGSVSR